MIAHVSPSAETFEDTFNTIKYADRAKKIKINLKANVLTVNFQLGQYTKIVEDLREEISGLKERIQELEEENRSLGRAGARPRVATPGTSHSTWWASRQSVSLPAGRWQRHPAASSTS